MTEREHEESDAGGDEITDFNVVVRAVRRFVQATAVAVLVAYVAILLTQVVLRYGFNSSIFWSEEIVRFGLVWNVLLGAALVSAQDGHIRVDILERLLPVYLRRWLQIFIDLTSLVFAMLLCGYGVDFLLRTAAQQSPVTHAPMGFAYAAIPVSASLIVFFTAAVFLRRLLTAGKTTR